MIFAILDKEKSSQEFARKELAELIISKGHSVFVGGVKDSIINKYYKDHNITFFNLSVTRNSLNPFKELASVLTVYKQIKKHSVENVIIYGIKKHFSFTLGSLFGGAKNIICIINGSGNLLMMGGIKGKILRALAFPCLRYAYKRCLAVCFQNNDDYIEFQKKKLINDKTNAFVTNGSGVNLSAFPFSPMPQENRFLFLSRITPSKGIREFLSAARKVKEKYPDCIFDVVGQIDNVVEKNCTDLVQNAIEENLINYYGYKNNVAECIEKARFFVLPSYYREGVPRCILEALSCGRPIITTNWQGCKETVMSNENGFLVPIKNCEAIAEKMIWLIEHPKEAEIMGQKSRKLAETKFDVNKINETLIGKFEE
ncbi:MAG: glycosyltransferase family 4 protein [Abditibacteriota bacterium]|nr:glycosyltransferase family 4 protein [Abditibacteriota bacterium]